MMLDEYTGNGPEQDGIIRAAASAAGPDTLAAKGRLVLWPLPPGRTESGIGTGARIGGLEGHLGQSAES
jgi:hypothetical protein